jgi:hypothetical protein
MNYTTKLLIFLISLMIGLWVTQSFIGCYNMLGGSSDWCERLL